MRCPTCRAHLHSWEYTRHTTACAAILWGTARWEGEQAVAAHEAREARRRIFGRRGVAFESEDGSVGFEAD